MKIKNSLVKLYESVWFFCLWLFCLVALICWLAWMINDWFMETRPPRLIGTMTGKFVIDGNTFIASNRWSTNAVEVIGARHNSEVKFQDVSNLVQDALQLGAIVGWVFGKTGGTVEEAEFAARLMDKDTNAVRRVREIIDQHKLGK